MIFLGNVAHVTKDRGLNLDDGVPGVMPGVMPDASQTVSCSPTLSGRLKLQQHAAYPVGWGRKQSRSQSEQTQEQRLGAAAQQRPRPFLSFLFFFLLHSRAFMTCRLVSALRPCLQWKHAEHCVRTFPFTSRGSFRYQTLLGGQAERRPSSVHGESCGVIFPSLTSRVVQTPRDLKTPVNSVNSTAIQRYWKSCLVSKAGTTTRAARENRLSLLPAFLLWSDSWMRRWEFTGVGSKPPASLNRILQKLSAPASETKTSCSCSASFHP